MAPDLEVKSLADLVSDDPAWPLIVEMIEAAPYPVEVLPADPARADEELLRVQVTTRSWLGAIVHRTGGLLVDHGWLRVFGSGHTERKLTSLAVANPADGPMLVAVDVLGGRFRWCPAEDDGPPTVHYFAPDSLEWEDLELGYGDWLSAMLGGALTGFAESLRWPSWPSEVTDLPLDQGLHLWPPPWTVEGKNVAEVSRRPVLMAELLLI
jgi:Protein of unknown function DUF2625